MDFTKVGSQIVKIVPGMSFNVCCHILMVGSKFGANNMKAWMHPASDQKFKQLLAV